MSRFLTELRRDSRGSILFLAAASLPLFIGAAGLATDTVLWSLWKRDLQRSADSASMAGALTVQQARYQAERAAFHDFRKSRAFRAHKANMWFENAPHKGPWSKDDNAVYVQVRLKTSLPFSDFFLKRPVFIEAESTATLVNFSESCLIALDLSANSSIMFDGSAALTMNCNAYSNSVSKSSITASGSASVSAPHVLSVGGVPRSGHYSASTELEEFQPPQIDPFRDVGDPRPANPCGVPVLVEPNQAVTLTPGCYQGMILKGTVHFAPGTYHITNADLYITSQARVTGSGVTFVLTAGPGSSLYPQFQVEGGPHIDLSAPTSGDYKNLLIYQDRDAPFLPIPNRVAGGSTAKLRGAMYFPNQSVRFTGNSSFNLDCFKVVARKIEMTGRSDFKNQCAEKDNRFAVKRVRLVA